ncbi:ATP-binding protein [Streptomyces sp. UNOB3_S3]|uniref:AAA family ATPase n=1 Tax=Streptomyces sp. UNOB3_S3 TaxID=2871682 RepID=UPI001E4AFA29|nr:ATP-binding protein [Streptomyces sp. UNOB3_S3]MCC3773408.1 ATP-binding protein [Streptomyces sp. UNOB3_S3]
MTAPTARPSRAPVPVPGDWLLARLAVVEATVRRAIAWRTGEDPTDGVLPELEETPFDPLHGLYVPDDMAPHLLDAPTGPLPPASFEDALAASVRAREDAATAAGAPPPVRRLAEGFGLDELATQVLLIALAPDVDARFERCYGYLNDDVTCRHATIGLALTLCGVPAVSATARRLFSPDAPLRAGGLLEVVDTSRPYPTRGLRVPDRVTAHLLGDDTMPAALRPLLAPPPAPPSPGDGPLAGAVRHVTRLLTRPWPVYLRDSADGTATAIAHAALAASGRQGLQLALDDADHAAPPADAVRAALLEARLRGHGLVIGPLGSPDDRWTRALLAPLADAPVPLVLTGNRPWDARWTRTPPVLADCPPLTRAERAALWRHELSSPTPWAPDPTAGDHATDDGAAGDDAVTAGARHRAGPARIHAVATAARRQAAARGVPVDAAAVREAARSWSGGALGRLARPVRPAVTWDDLVLPERPHEQLRDLVRRVRHRDRVLGQWRMRPGGGRGRGVGALFSGGSGTGKTLAAEVVAAELGLDLHVVDLATVVDKYIGETEKHLERIFTAADADEAVLLFDEADAVFGKRTPAQDAHDRYANTGTSYLLQRLESFDGLALLTTNMHANIDPAFLRRLDLVVHFPAPDETLRRALWERCLGPAVPRAGDVGGAGLAALASAFDLSGGAIRCCAVTAAYRAADDDRPVALADLLAAVREEYAKLGRYMDESAFPQEVRP